MGVSKTLFVIALVGLLAGNVCAEPDHSEAVSAVEE